MNNKQKVPYAKTMISGMLIQFLFLYFQFLEINYESYCIPEIINIFCYISIMGVLQNHFNYPWQNNS